VRRNSDRGDHEGALGAELQWPRWTEAQSNALGVSIAAGELLAGSDVIDLHIDSYIWVRLCGYRLHCVHDSGPLRGRYFRQVDLPRLREVGVKGAIWVVTTNPARTARGRIGALQRNIAALSQELLQDGAQVGLASSAADYSALVAAGKHAAFLGIQGGSALGAAIADLRPLPPELIRVTLLHLYGSALGRSSAPLSNLGQEPLSGFGVELVHHLNRGKVFVDLAHIDRGGFFAALEAHDRSLPPIVTHTGVAGCYPHWRNIDDEQIRAIADRGGVIGIMYHSPFLAPGWGRGSLSSIVDHLEHTLAVGGEHCAALGSDWDGAIVTPRDMPTCRELPRLVQEMLNRGWAEERIQNVLGRNFLRCLRDLRG
jgi:membrane dipeptidase